jgi:2'-5' RNA ligase
LGFKIDMRLFIAIEIPEDIKKLLTEIQGSIKDSGVDAGWTRPEGIHLTLKFLGEVPEAKAAEIMAALSHATKETTGIRLDVAGAGAFPNPKNARVVWIGISGETDKLTRLQSAVEEAMVALGFKREDRPFTPHLTLGRIKFIRSRDKWLKALDGIKDIKLSGFDTRTVSLMKSELKPSGSVYTEIGKIELGT